MKIPKPDFKPDKTLNTFKDYGDFLNFSKALFKLSPEEYRVLYEVLLKLQSIGEDPIETMLTWRKHTCTDECPEFIRFMIQIDKMEIESLTQTA